MSLSPPVPPRPDVTSWYPEPAAPATTLATPGQRLGGFLLDCLIMVPVIVVLVSLRWSSMRPLIDWISAHPGQTSFPPALITEIQNAFGPVFLGCALAWYLYLTLMVGWRGQTFGKMAAHTKVVRARGGGKAGFGRAAIRAAIPMLWVVIPSRVAIVIPFVVYGWLLFSERRQGLHDLAAGTVVIRI